ncbi:MAG: hypothetical protein BGN96_14945 [Bacteroidales bacterium 45-6]|nr:MAG: hypothetical protein BGN96_14945 [Bacteroidales bacterium 45-6]
MKRVNYLLITLFIIFAGCANDSKRLISGIQHKEIAIERFDKDFREYLDEKSVSDKQQLTLKYPVLLSAFGKVIVNNPETTKPGFFQSLDKYFSDTTLLKIYDDAVKKFDNVEKIENELSLANEHLWSIYPGKQLPRLSMHVSGFKQNVIVTDSVISLSIDKYLGSDYPIYKDFFYDYQRAQMKPEFVVRDYLKAYIISNLLPESKTQDLVSAMIREGKCLYAISQLLPDTDPESLIGYNGKQLKWCKNNERAVWRGTIERKFLYNTEYLIISKYMDDAPYTSLISPLSPGKIGAWMGLQIVESFVAKNPKVRIPEIMQMDEHKLLELSKYVP